MFKTFLANIVFIVYLIVFIYLVADTCFDLDDISLNPSLFLNFIEDVKDFFSQYSVDIIYNDTLVNLFDYLESFFTNSYLYISLIIVTFGTIIVNILNSLFFSNKLYVLYNFLINLN